jgi:hypothetical protein
MGTGEIHFSVHGGSLDLIKSSNSRRRARIALGALGFKGQGAGEGKRKGERRCRRKN